MLPVRNPTLSFILVPCPEQVAPRHHSIPLRAFLALGVKVVEPDFT